MIYDCVTYKNEDIILELRFNTLNKFVDKFIIVEATKNHAGKPKKLNFSIEKFKKFEEKIRYIIVDDMPEKVSSFYYNRRWWHENIVRDIHQRNQIMRGLQDAQDDDLIVISDIDEIPDLSKLNNFKLKKYAVFSQRFYKYKFNLLSPSQTPYQGSRIVRKKYLKSPQWLRHQYSKKIKFWQIHRYFTNPPIIKNGGWHFSFIGSPETVKNKIEDYAHGEINTQKNKDLDRIKQKIRDNEDVIDDVVLQKVELDNTFPEYILKNQDKFKNFILK